MKKENITSTQKGVIAEHIVANELMIETDGRFSPFSPLADDEGIDLLIYDKKTGKAVPIQIKSRTGGIIKKGKETNTIHFEIRSVSLKNKKYAYFLAVLLKDIKTVERAWLIPMKDISSLLNISKKHKKYIMRANKSLMTKDKFSEYQCKNIKEVTQRIKKILEAKFL